MCQLNDDLLSAQKCQSGHDAEAKQDEEHLEKLLPRWVKLMWEDLQKGDVNKCPGSEPLQDGLD